MRYLMGGSCSPLKKDNKLQFLTQAISNSLPFSRDQVSHESGFLPFPRVFSRSTFTKQKSGFDFSACNHSICMNHKFGTCKQNHVVSVFRATFSHLFDDKTHISCTYYLPSLNSALSIYTFIFCTTLVRYNTMKLKKNPG